MICNWLKIYGYVSIWYNSRFLLSVHDIYRPIHSQVVMIMLNCIFFQLNYVISSYYLHWPNIVTLQRNKFILHYCSSTAMMSTLQMYPQIVQGIIVLDLEVREGGRFFLPTCSIRSLVTPKKVLSSTRRGEAVFLGHALFWCQWRCSVWYKCLLLYILDRFNRFVWLLCHFQLQLNLYKLFWWPWRVNLWVNVKVTHKMNTFVWLRICFATMHGKIIVIL